MKKGKAAFIAPVFIFAGVSLGFGDTVTSSLDNSDPTFYLPASGSVTDYLTGEVASAVPPDFVNADIVYPQDSNGDVLTISYVGPRDSGQTPYTGDLLSLVVTGTTPVGTYTGGSLVVYDFPPPVGGVVRADTSAPADDPSFSINIEAVPEPPVWLLLIFGGSVVFFLRRFCPPCFLLPK